MARSLLTAWGMRVTGEAVELLLGQRQSLELFKTRDLLSMFGVAAGDVVGARVHHALQSRVQSRAMSAAASYVYSRISGGLVMNYSAVCCAGNHCCLSKNRNNSLVALRPLSSEY